MIAQVDTATATMLGLLTITAIPTTIGIAEGVSAQKKQNEEQNDEKLLRKFTLDCWCGGKGKARDAVHGGKVVLGDEKVGTDIYLDPDRSAKPHMYHHRPSMRRRRKF